MAIWRQSAERTPLLTDPTGSDQVDESEAEYGILDRVAEATISGRNERVAKNAVKAVGFVWAIMNSLGAGAITCFSIYGHILQEQRGYSQIQVNILSITAGVSMYVLVPAFGYLADHRGPRLASLLSGIILSASYLLAAFCFRSGIPSSFGGAGLPFWLMVLAFVGVGAGTGCMYLSGLTLCAKNFGRGESKGKALSIPIAFFGLSGMCFSQIGSRLLYELNPDGSRGDVDVFKFFLFLSITLLILGVGGRFTLVVVDEDELIMSRYEDLAQSGVLGAEAQDPDAEDPFLAEAMVRHGYADMLDLTASQSQRVHDLARDLQKIEEEALLAKKNKLLSVELTMFLTDKTMWLLSVGFFLVTGPGETFINNIGSIIRSLYPDGIPSAHLPTTAATHVSIVAVSSTITRLLMGFLSDMVSPSAHRTSEPDDCDSEADSLSIRPTRTIRCKWTISRVVFLILSALMLALGQAILASGAAESNKTALVTVSALVGGGYGAVFALVPIVVSVVWGVENFGTNWGIVAMTPAGGATVWGLIYACFYGAAIKPGPVLSLLNTVAGVGIPLSSIPTHRELRFAPRTEVGDADSLVAKHSICYGTACYSPTFWLMSASSVLACVLWILAWRGPGGWRSRRVAV